MDAVLVEHGSAGGRRTSIAALARRRSQPFRVWNTECGNLWYHDGMRIGSASLQHAAYAGIQTLAQGSIGSLVRRGSLALFPVGRGKPGSGVRPAADPCSAKRPTSLRVVLEDACDACGHAPGEVPLRGLVSSAPGRTPLLGFRLRRVHGTLGVAKRCRASGLHNLRRFNTLSEIASCSSFTLKPIPIIPEIARHLPPATVQSFPKLPPSSASYSESVLHNCEKFPRA
jgi:hypothetical protein